MYFDPQCKPVTVPEIKLEPWRQALLKAAEIVRERGLCQGQMVDKQQRVCAMGAMSIAMSGLCDHRWMNLYIMATNAVIEELARRKQINLGGIPDWNDQPGRTKEEVIDVLTAAAKA